MKIIMLQILEVAIIILSIDNLIAQRTHTLNDNRAVSLLQSEIKYSRVLKTTGSANTIQSDVRNSLTQKLFGDKINGAGISLNKQLQFRSLNKLSKCNNQKYLPDTAITYSINAYLTIDTIRYCFSYNSKGLLTLGLREKLSNGQWTNLTRSTMTYDLMGNELSELYEEWHGQWTNKSRKTYTYDANGNRLSYFSEIWSNEQWTNYFLYNYTYDANGHVLTESSPVWLNGQWVNSGLKTYTYDANGHVLTEFTQGWQNGQWVNSELHTHTYDARRLEITELIQTVVYEDGNWCNYFLYTYTYDANGNRLTALLQDCVISPLNNYPWFNFILYTYTYDANGNIPSWSYYLWKNADISFKDSLLEATRHSCTYDLNGNRLSDLWQDSSNGQLTNKYLYLYTYDSCSNLLSESFTLWSNSRWTQQTEFLAYTNYSINAGNHIYYLDGFYAKISYMLMNTTDVSTKTSNIATEYLLLQNYPNPFNPSTTISFSLPSKSFVSLKILDMLGREVATLINREMSAGTHSERWNSGNASSGVYFYKLQVGSFSETKKLLLLH
jgi:hypothetical protein